LNTGNLLLKSCLVIFGLLNIIRFVGQGVNTSEERFLPGVEIGNEKPVSSWAAGSVGGAEN
jgi:hypothetical protein